ncbi:class I SAM-dependent methyltransferase [Amycolatopsis pithecellobii]|uniref:Methyltransferase domain-containing protein n=1 Tax=Amycolatopsis pithecellobii TaxID=664692 RepID=A0A6N7ZCJ1_9PSEU|nr:class I SAM-dependent methyltransferase [Amycolatopsis pithecellobii]MTD59514.1 methyltransferase domain-containing protein [Amycolatopsis pithecellobii]
MWRSVRRGLKALSRDGVVPSPNIWYHPDVYELENRVQDVDGEIWRVLGEEASWTGRTVLDLGCGAGFHLPKFAEDAGAVIGVEPHEPLVHKARHRVAELANIRLLGGSAQRIPVPDASVDIVHARTAYFFGPGCEPGIREADRVLRPGGALMIVDLDATAEPYGRWMRADLPHYDPAAVESFFARNGFRCRRVATRWRFRTRGQVESVLNIEFSPKIAAGAIEDVLRRGDEDGYTLPVGYRVHVREKPTGLVVPGHSSSSSESISPRMP